MPKVLVIDDEPTILTLIDLLLRHEGYDVVLADNGSKGLELYRHERPDAIVLDVEMPEMDGIAVLKHIRSVDRTQPVIVLTGDTSTETERQVRALGMTEFLVKGSSLRLLKDTLHRLPMTAPPAIVTHR